MHNHPINSPAATTRLLALVMMADGNVCHSEISTVERLALARLGLPPDRVRMAMQELCEDFFLYSDTGAMSSFGDATLEALIREVDDETLQAIILEAVEATFGADGHLSEGEQRLLRTFQRCWTVGRTAARNPLPN